MSGDTLKIIRCKAGIENTTDGFDEKIYVFLDQECRSSIKLYFEDLGGDEDMDFEI